MYEIWLALNIAWETLLPLALPIGIAALVLAGLWAAALRKGNLRHNGAFRWAVAGAVIAALVAFATLPALTQSSLANLGYWIDYAVLAALSVGIGVAAALYVWPIAALWSTRRPDNQSVPQPMAG